MLATLILSGYFLISHFVMTFLYVAPINSIKIALYDRTQLWGQDLYAQNWALFAPTPIHHNSQTLARFRTKSGVVSDWYDVGQGFVEGLHASLLSPYTRLVRIPVTATRLYFGSNTPDQEILRDAICVHQPEQDLCRREDPTTKETRTVGEKVLVRLASAAGVEWAAQHDEEVLEVQFRLVQMTTRPFTKRDDTTWQPEMTGVESEWLSFEPAQHLPFQLLDATGG